MISPLLVIATTLAWMALEGAVSTREPHASLPRELATGVALFAVHASAITESVVRGCTPTATVLVAGMALITIGVALRISAIGVLGGAFVSTTTAPVRVIKTGPYRVLRHPSEVGLVCAALGAAVLCGSFVATLVTVLVLAPMSVARCRMENRAMRGAVTWAR